MSHRDECIISTYEDAKQWLEMYRDTIIDEQALQVIYVLEQKACACDHCDLEDKYK